jgi:hypothetical protein
MFHRMLFKPRVHNEDLLVPRGCGLNPLYKGMISVWFQRTMFLSLFIFCHVSWVWYFYHVYHMFIFQLRIRNFYNIFFHVSNILMLCNSWDMFLIKFLPCFRGFKMCLFNFFFIFQGYVLHDFLNQHSR